MRPISLITVQFAIPVERDLQHPETSCVRQRRGEEKLNRILLLCYHLLAKSFEDREGTILWGIRTRYPDPESQTIVC